MAPKYRILLVAKSLRDLRTARQLNVKLTFFEKLTGSFGSKLCKNSPNFVDDRTGLHLGYKGALDQILIAHIGIRK